MANATKHELYTVNLSFSVLHTDEITGVKKVTRDYGGDLLIMTKNDDVQHIAQMVTAEFLNKPTRYDPNAKIQKVHITKLKKLKFQPSLGVIVEE